MNGKIARVRTVAALLAFALCALFPHMAAFSSMAVPGIKIAHPEIPRMPAAELARLLKKKADIVILDTQPSDGYAMWHIPSAVNVPYVVTDDPMPRQLQLLQLPTDKMIVIYCLCEEGTDSAAVAVELKQLGYSEAHIKVLEEGLVQWDAKGYPMIKQEIANSTEDAKE